MAKYSGPLQQGRESGLFMRPTLTALLVCVLFLPGSAQQSTQTQSPQEIADNVAYHLTFLHFSAPPTATVADLERLQKIMASIFHFDRVDQAAFTNVLRNYRTDYANVRQSAKDQTDFNTQKQRLVQRTLDNLYAQLSPSGIAKFTASVQEQKINMRVDRGAN